MGIPRAQSVVGSGLLLSQGNSTLQKHLQSLVLGSWHTQNEREARAQALLQGQQLPAAGATLNAIWKIPTSPSSLRKKAWGGVSRREAALQAGLLQSTTEAGLGW